MIYDPSLPIVCSNLADNNLNGDIPVQLLQVAQHKYGRYFFIITDYKNIIIFMPLHNYSKLYVSSFTGNNFNCDGQSDSCVKDTENPSKLQISM
jgi:hypothetical protein